MTFSLHGLPNFKFQFLNFLTGCANSDREVKKRRVDANALPSEQSKISGKCDIEMRKRGKPNHYLIS